MRIVDGWVDEAIEINCMHKSMSRAGYKPSHIVIHGTAGGSSAQNIGYYFRDSTVQSSTHFVIGRDGVIVQCVSCDVAAWGNGSYINPRIAGLPNANPNYWTISIELVKPSSNNSDIPTDLQYTALIALVSLLCATYGIAARYGDGKSGIIAHGDLDSVNRSGCPGTFDWNRLFSGIQGGHSMGVPAGWSDDGNVLTAPNKNKVMFGFRSHVLNSGWDPDNQPFTEEYAVDIVQIHAPEHGGGTRQEFRDCVLWWTGKLGVIEEKYIGWEVSSAYKRIAEEVKKTQTALSTVDAMEAENEALQAQIEALKNTDTEALKAELAQAKLDVANAQQAIAVYVQATGQIMAATHTITEVLDELPA